MLPSCKLGSKEVTTCGLPPAYATSKPARPPSAQAAISMTCELPALGKTVGPMPIVSLLVDDGDGYCRLHGIRFQVDVAGEDITTFFGQEMKAAISFEDLDGATASDELWVTLSSDTI
jgi:hypothetical protein